MEMKVEQVCKELVRRKLQSADAVKTIYKLWHKETRGSNDARQFMHWLAAKHFVSKEEVTKLVEAAAAKPAVKAKPAAKSPVPDSPRIQEPAVAIARPVSTEILSPEINVEPVDLELPRRRGRDLMMFLLGAMAGALVAVAIWAVAGL